MKKLLIPAIALCMVMGFSAVSMAATLSMDILGGGELDDGSEPYDLSEVAVGFEFPNRDFKFAGKVTSGTYDDLTENLDTASVLLKGGVALVNDRQLRLDLIGGLYSRATDMYHLPYGYTTQTYSSLMVGFDARIKLDKRAWIDFSYAFGVNPQMDIDDGDYIYNYDLDALSLLNFKFNMLIAPRFGVSFGYTSDTIDYEGSPKDTYSGLTLGGFVRF